ncbi:MAG: RHS repeat-associated core domain-containing protein [Bacteroidales bacterium]|nr:RHS repeat-associated core domain-containing protein [Bacteroidales bacterium]
MQYLPYGELFVSQSLNGYDARYKFTGKERDVETGYDYFGFRYYDSDGSTWISSEPLFGAHTDLSPYNYCSWNPVGKTDPDGAWDDGYRDLFGNYQWFDSEHSNIIMKDDRLWTKVSDNKTIFEMAKSGMLDNMPTTTNQVQITETDNLTTFEMWLNAPSETKVEATAKIASNIVYSMANSPYSLLIGKTIGGTPLNSKEKTDAFIDVVPGLLSFGLTKTGEVVNTTKKGLQGFNQFIKRTPRITTTNGLPTGTTWQQRASQLFKSNKVNQQALKDFNMGLKIGTIITNTQKELDK